MPWDQGAENLGPFCIADRLEDSGVANTYVGVPRHDPNQTCAIKHLRLSARHQASLIDAFRAAGKLGRSLSHSNVAPTLMVGHQEGSLFIAHIIEQGVALKKIPTRPLPVDIAVVVVRKIAAALRYLHRQKEPLWHGRIAPENIRVAFCGDVHLMDCCLASKMGEPVALPRALWPNTRYLAPEIEAGAATTPQSEVYALSVVLWELLTGRPLGRPRQSRHVPLASRFNPDVPDGLDVCIARGIDPEPDRRFADVAKLDRALLRFGPIWLARKKIQRFLSTIPELEESRTRVEQRLAAIRSQGEPRNRRRVFAGRSSLPRAKFWRPIGWAFVWLAGVTVIVLASNLSNNEDRAGVAAARHAAGASDDAPKGDGTPFVKASPPPAPPEASSQIPPTRDMVVPVATTLTPSTIENEKTGEKPARRFRSKHSTRTAESTEKTRARGLAILRTAQDRFQWGDLAGAEQLARESIAALPGEAQAHYFLGLVLMAGGQASAATKSFRAAVQIDPHHIEAQTKLRLAKDQAAFRERVDYDSLSP